MVNSKRIDSKLKIQKRVPDIELCQQISEKHKLNLNDVKRALSVNVIPVSALSALCGYSDVQNVQKKIKGGYLTCGHPFSIVETRRGRNVTFKGFLFVKLDTDCLDLIRKRLAV